LSEQPYVLPAAAIAPLPVVLPWTCDACGQEQPYTVRPALRQTYRLECQASAPSRCRGVQALVRLCPDCAGGEA
jgi:hypothetical protein